MHRRDVHLGVGRLVEIGVDNARVGPHAGEVAASRGAGDGVREQHVELVEVDDPVHANAEASAQNGWRTMTTKSSATSSSAPDSATIIEKWEPIMGVSVADWGVKQMKTRWGTCNIKAHRIWLNLELAKKPHHSLEYIVVHEMTHLLEKHHNDHFKGLMDKFLPQWRQYREALNRAPLGHEEWEE